jgi:hypothetical protein
LFVFYLFYYYLFFKRFFLSDYSLDLELTMINYSLDLLFILFYTKNFPTSFGILRVLVFAQALPLVGTFWGVVLFGEYRKSSKRTYTLLGSMLAMFIAAVVVLMASSGHRK